MQRRDSQSSLNRQASSEKKSFLPSLNPLGGANSAAASNLFPPLKGQTTPNGSQREKGKATVDIGFEDSPERKATGVRQRSRPKAAPRGPLEANPNFNFKAQPEGMSNPV